MSTSSVVNTSNVVGEDELANVPLNVSLRYNHVKLNKNRSVASTSLQRSIDDTEQQLQVINNRCGTKETTL